MTEKTVIITGGSDGIGKAAARLLKEQGAQVVIVGRSPQKTKAVGTALKVPYYIADFTKLAEVRALGNQLHAKYPQIDVLFNNAGGVYGKREVTVDGFEKTFQINYLAHFLLTDILLDTLIASQATIINTSSIGNSGLSKLDINDLNLETKYSRTRAYGNAKLEVILFAKEFNRRYGQKGVSMVAFHPGNVVTNFGAESPGMMHVMYHTFVQKLMGMIPPEKGADTAIWLATTTPGKDWQPGEYYYKRKIAKAHKLAYDKDIARSLWTQSEEMIGERYPTFK
ncbi:SDR family NAD(P)-dependent oxidoreductase [Loigolactobacillus binensis]|uniref:SDR family NAD(P)-dependent oxidoreductase n=1 Tax=Loigolactobacillus binensis TaxID=2559922 RepID=A0ABW3EAS9_9LACO|nr:SDR family NAD(P)-dependent oxidoreductase [Loigolactobacillus binensis]